MSSSLALSPLEAGPANRITWMDTLRGVSILLVMFHHSFGLTYDDPESAPTWLWGFNESFQPLRMPLMVFLSGLLVPTSWSKGTARYVKGKLKNVAHPYFVWSGICLIILFGASVTLGRDFDATTVWRVFYRPIEHMWFLAFLFIYYMLALGTRRIEPLILALGSIALAWAPIGGSWEKFWFLLGFFLLGVGVATHERWSACLIARRSWMLFGLVSFAILLWASLKDAQVRYDPAFSFFVLICIMGACVAAQAVDAPPSLRGVRFLGKESLIFYVTHYPSVLVFLVILRKIMPELPEPVVFPLAMLFALALGTALVIAANRVPGASWLFRFSGNRPRRHPIGA